MSSSLLILLIPLLLLTTTSNISAPSSFINIVNAYSSSFPSYEDCAPSLCGNSIIQYPFGTCGFSDIQCVDNVSVLLFFGATFVARALGDITTSSYRSRTLQISTQDSIEDSSVSYDWLTGQGAFFNLSDGYTMGTISNCPQRVYSRESENNRDFFFYSQIGVQSCISYPIIIPNSTSYNISADRDLEELQQIGFQITWSVPENCKSCQTSGGRCYRSIFCICPRNRIYWGNCSDGMELKAHKEASLLPVIPAVCAVLLGIAVVSCIVVHRQRSAKSTASDEEDMIRAFMDPLDPRPPSLENFLQYYKSQVPRRYSYSQIRAYTNNLADKIGKGGFGTVYKGKLPSGCLIAVKILDESKQSKLPKWLQWGEPITLTWCASWVIVPSDPKELWCMNTWLMVPSKSTSMEAMRMSWIGNSYIQLLLVQLVV